MDLAKLKERLGAKVFEPIENPLRCHPRCGCDPHSPPREHFKMCPNHKCCENEKRDWDGGCVNCGDACL